VSIIREEFAWSEDKSNATIRQISEAKFEFVIVSILREYFEHEFREVASKMKNFDIYRVIDDFILIMMFVGNDFLPKMFCFGIREGHLNDLLEKYKEYLIKCEDYINNSGKVDWKNVTRLLEIAKEFETIMIQEKLLRKQNNQQNEEGSKWDDEVANNFAIENNTIVKGRNYYYKSRFDINIDDPTDEKKFDDIIIKYLEGLEFYCTYYYVGCQSWSWFYPYHYTPLVNDVYDYLKKHKVD
jgi:5'-3' exoribonuclease 1